MEKNYKANVLVNISDFDGEVIELLNKEIDVNLNNIIETVKFYAAGYPVSSYNIDNMSFKASTVYDSYRFTNLYITCDNISIMSKVCLFVEEATNKKARESLKPCNGDGCVIC